MLHTIVPYDDIFPQEVPRPRYVQDGNDVWEYRYDGYGFDALTRLYSTNLCLYLRPPIQ